MTASAPIRPLLAADAEAGLALSRAAGWNQTAADWAFMIAYGEAFGISASGGGTTSGGGLAGSALALPLGPRLGWLGMVLVAADHRRRGFGTRLLRHCLDQVERAGAVAGLDATELGRPVYLPLGFRDLYPISRWVLEVPPAPTRKPVPDGKGRGIAAPGLRRAATLPDDEMERLEAFDGVRSGLQRAPILRYLAGHRRGWIAETGAHLAGYALGRPGVNFAQIGPVVADDPDVAAELIAAALADGGRFVLDVPDAHAATAAFLEGRGAVRQRGYMRMVRGDAPGIAEPGAVFALAGPEFA